MGRIKLEEAGLGAQPNRMDVVVAVSRASKLISRQKAQNPLAPLTKKD